MVVHEPQRYDARSHPGLFLADFVAIQTRRCLRHAVEPGRGRARRESLEAVTGHLGSRICLSLASVAAACASRRPCTTLAANGQAAVAVRQAFAGRPTGTAYRTEQPRWVLEQAQQWIEAVGGTP